jgi:electron transfer flavoprotein alpha subunit
MTTAELLTAARALGEPSAVVIGGPGTAAPLVEDLKAAGAAKIYVAESDVVDNYLITPFVDVLESIVESASPAAVLVPATADGKEIAGLLAARIGSRQGHFMKPAMLHSQLAALEPPPDALAVDITPPPDEIVAQIRLALAL